MSFNPETFVDGGGLLDDAIVTVVKARTVMFDYKGTQDPAPALLLVLQPEDGDPIDQYWTCGKAADWKPSEDGKSMVPIGTARAIVKSSNVGILMMSLVNSGFPGDKLDDVTNLEGLKGHVIRQDPPESSGDSDIKRGRTLVFDEIISMPGEGKENKKKRAAPKSGGKREGIDVDTLLNDTITEILVDNDEIKKSKIANFVNKSLAGRDDISESVRREAVKRSIKDDFLSSNPDWAYEDGVLSLG